MPRNASASSDPISSRLLSTSTSTRETKKLATEWTSDRGTPSSSARSRPARYAAMTSRYRSTEKMSVTLMSIPSARASVMAGRLALVAGIFT